MFRIVGVLAFCLVVSGCSKISEIMMPVSAKVNAAFPPDAEVRIAQENLLALLRQDAATAEAFREQWASRMDLRARNCGQGLSIGRFDTLAQVSALAIDRGCLRTQDAQLLQYLGIRQIAFRLAQPALRPLAPLAGPTLVPSIDGAEIYTGEAASSAGVALVRGARGELMSVEIPGGQKIAILSAVPEAGYQMLLSPNGRVAALQSNNGVIFVDTETGGKLWTTREIRRFLAWLPEVSAGLASDAKGGALALIDFQAGKVDTHPIALRNTTWAVRYAAAPSRTLVGSYRDFTLLEHTRDANGIHAAAIKEFQLAQGRGVTSSRPTLMLDGKAIVFVSSRDFMMVNLDSGQETLWQTGDFLNNNYAKLNETSLLVDSRTVGNVYTKPQVFDIQASTLAPIDSEDGRSGILLGLDGRSGYMRRSSNGMLIGGDVKAGAPVPLDTLVASFNLEKQLAKLAAEERAAEMAAARPAYGSAYPPSAPPMAPVPNSVIAALSRDAQVEAIGVYKGKASASVASGGGHRQGTVEVRVRRSLKPTVLVLSSYEPVRWNVVPEPGAKIAAVLVSGYYASQVVGAGSARIAMTGSAYAYQQGSPQYNALNRDVMRWTGKGIAAFQGRYEGASFSVGR